MIGKVLGAVACAVVTTSAVHAAPFVVLYESEQAGMTTTSATFSKVGVETFDNATSKPSFKSNFGGSSLTGTYSGLNNNSVQITGTGAYGGAGGVGKYAVAFRNTPYSLKLDQGVDYFGYWLSALDSGNTVSFFSGDKMLFAFDADDALKAVNSAPTKKVDDYYGKPGTGATRAQRVNHNEPYIFLNFFSTSRYKFDRIEFSEKPTYGGGYESDNHTVGFYKTMGTGTLVPQIGSVSAVPEPATWTIMIIGFGLVGGAMRRRTAQVLQAA